ncbi:MAG TPA: class I SAM-dependent methyltransferase [Planctomycetes bacterium]|nr:class I SAM-dependent methyltransferase [Planctomycetota bacterium]HIK59869.1 class I SAM-dependent methyltransferase [Planctomycetota bacterium]
MIVDFGKTSADYARHRLGFPEQFFDAIRERGLASPGSRVLDVGSGTGALALPFASRGAHVTALDVSRPLLECAHRGAADRGLELVTVQSKFENNSLPSNEFDFICAGQCWHWLEPRAATLQLERLLATNGRVLLCSYDWLPIEGSVVAATEALILEHNPGWNWGGLDGRHPEWEHDLTAGGFEVLETAYGEHDAPYTHEAWRGRIRASAGIAASLSPDAVQAFDRAHEELLKAEFGEDPLVVPHVYGFCLARTAER